MSSVAPPDVENRIDARPMRPTSTATLWDQAAALRDKFALEVRQTLDGEGIEAAVLESPKGNYPPTVRLEAWLPTAAGKDSESAGRERAELEFTIETRSYHEHELVVSARLSRGKKQIAVVNRPDFHFPMNYVAEWTRYAVDRGGVPENYAPKWEAFVGFIVALVPFMRPLHDNRVKQEFRTSMSAMTVLVVVSAIVLFVGGLSLVDRNGGEPPLGSLLLLLIGVAGLFAAGVVVHRRLRAVVVSPQSTVPPRDLGLVDSWHVVVADLGSDFANVQQRLIRSVTQDADLGVTSQMETYTQRAPNGYEQRERLVIAKDQGMVHVQIYQFGNDLFVGWHAYLNWAQWGETSPVSTKIRAGREVEYRDLRPAVYVPSQFDLIDLSSLSEFVHRRVERELKILMKEKAIDQEIDFKIIRGDRDRALDKSRHTEGDTKKTNGWRYRTGT